MTPLSPDLLESLAAEALREGLADALYTHVASPIGPLLVVEAATGVCKVSFADAPDDRELARVATVFGARLLESDQLLATTREAFAAYFDGVLDALDLPVDLALVGQPFRRRVLDELRTVGPGRVVTYGQLAAATDNPRAARAVGTACAQNPVPLVVPCHRVLPSSGGIGAYGGGTDRKRTLLALERALPR